MKLVKRPYPKDWERRRLVRTELAKRDMTVTDLSIALRINRGNLSSVINGTRRSRKTETRIAAYFGKEWCELFPARSDEELVAMREREAGGRGGGGAA
jgi:lambda repressor-like predicted transcriptional regulator